MYNLPPNYPTCQAFFAINYPYYIDGPLIASLNPSRSRWQTLLTAGCYGMPRKRKKATGVGLFTASGLFEFFRGQKIQKSLGIPHPRRHLASPARTRSGQSINSAGRIVARCGEHYFNILFPRVYARDAYGVRKRPPEGRRALINSVSLSSPNFHEVTEHPFQNFNYSETEIALYC